MNRRKEPDRFRLTGKFEIQCLKKKNGRDQFQYPDAGCPPVHMVIFRFVRRRSAAGNFLQIYPITLGGFVS
jgi:hypothetical protein